MINNQATIKNIVITFACFPFIFCFTRFSRDHRPPVSTPQSQVRYKCKTKKPKQEKQEKKPVRLRLCACSFCTGQRLLSVRRQQPTASRLTRLFCLWKFYYFLDLQLTLTASSYSLGLSFQVLSVVFKTKQIKQNKTAAVLVSLGP